MLDHKSNGDCIYLGDTGCTIHARRPQMCRELDCRILATQLNYTQARKLNVITVWKRGKELLRTERPRRSANDRIDHGGTGDDY